MSDTVSGTVERGKAPSKMTANFSGKLTSTDWEAFKKELEQLAKKYPELKISFK